MQVPKPCYWLYRKSTSSADVTLDHVHVYADTRASLGLFHDRDAQVLILTARARALNSIAYIMCLKSWYSESCMQHSAFISRA